MPFSHDHINSLITKGFISDVDDIMENKNVNANMFRRIYSISHLIVPTVSCYKVLRFPDTFISFSVLREISKGTLFCITPNIRTVFCCSWFEFKVLFSHYDNELD